MEALERKRSREVWDVREERKRGLRGMLESQPRDMLVASLLRGVLSPETLKSIVEDERREFDLRQQASTCPTYDNLVTTGRIEGVKVGRQDGLKVFRGPPGGVQVGRVIGFLPAAKRCPQCGPRRSSVCPGGPGRHPGSPPRRPGPF